MTRLVLGVDVGFLATGWALIDVANNRVERCCVIRTERTAKKRGVRVADDDAERCCRLRLGLIDAIEGEPLEHLGAICELPHAGAKGARAIRCMALATGAVVVTLAAFQIPVEYVTPRDVKLIAANAKASKADVEEEVGKHFEFSEIAESQLRHISRGLHEHIYDACGAVLAAWDGNICRAARQSMVSA